MSTRTRYALNPMPVNDVALFQSGEEAWFWFIRCQLIRYQGIQPTGTMGALARPCDPDDIYRAVIHLHKQRCLTSAHLRTLSQYGLAERTPDARCSEEATAARLWSEAICHLEDRLRQKGIVDSSCSDIDIIHCE